MNSQILITYSKKDPVLIFLLCHVNEPTTQMSQISFDINKATFSKYTDICYS